MAFRAELDCNSTNAQDEQNDVFGRAWRRFLDLRSACRSGEHAGSYLVLFLRVYVQLKTEDCLCVCICFVAECFNAI